jgi:hypothetical protein
MSEEQDEYLVQLKQGYGTLLISSAVSWHTEVHWRVL